MRLRNVLPLMAIILTGACSGGPGVSPIESAISTYRGIVEQVRAVVIVEDGALAPIQPGIARSSPLDAGWGAVPQGRGDSAGLGEQAFEYIVRLVGGDQSAPETVAIVQRGGPELTTGQPVFVQKNAEGRGRVLPL